MVSSSETKQGEPNQNFAYNNRKILYVMNSNVLCGFIQSSFQAGVS
jgi:hypothetical protein